MNKRPAQEKDCPKCGEPMLWKNLEKDRCPSCGPDTRDLNWQVVGDSNGVPHPTPGMWEMVSELLHGEKLPVSVGRAILLLADGQMVVEQQDLRQKYDDLLMQVETKHPGESRHDTAKRYIRNAEQQDNRPEQEAT